MSPRIKTFVKKCEDFYVCAEIGEKGAFGYEFVEDRKTMYQYIIKGQISLITISEDDLTRQVCNSDNGLIDVKKYHYHTVYLSIFSYRIWLQHILFFHL